MHPLLALLTTRPQLLVDHAQAYTALFNEEFDLARASWQRRVLLLLVALGCLSTAAVLAGVGLMLWAISPVLPAQAQWVLPVTPLAPLLVAFIFLAMARRAARKDAFANLRRQIGADMALLRAVGSS